MLLHISFQSDENSRLPKTKEETSEHLSEVPVFRGYTTFSPKQGRDPPVHWEMTSLSEHLLLLEYYCVSAILLVEQQI